eukprot:11335_1
MYVEEEEEEKYPQETYDYPHYSSPSLVDGIVETRTTINIPETKHRIGEVTTDRNQVMLLQQMTDKKKKTNTESTCRVMMEWIIIVSAFVSLCIAWIADAPLVSAAASENTVNLFDTIGRQVLIQSGAPTHWYFTKVQWPLHVGALGYSTGGGGRRLGGAGARRRPGGAAGHGAPHDKLMTQRIRNALPTLRPDYNAVSVDYVQMSNAMVSWFGWIAYWGTLIPMIILGIGSVLTTLRFCCKSSSRKLKSVTMLGVGLAMIGSIMVIIDTFQVFVSLDGSAFILRDRDGNAGWKFEYCGWANIAAFVLMLLLEIFDICSK